MPKRFGKPKGPSKEDIEAQAQREVERLTRASMGPTGGPMGGGGMGPGAPGGLPTPLDNIARSLKGRSVKQGPRLPTKGPSLLPQGPVGSSLVGGSKPGVTNPFGEVPQGGVGDSLDTGGGSYGAPSYEFLNDEEAEDEEINITEMALRDHAARFGTRPEDLVVQVDVVSAEQMRDQAMAQFIDRQERRQPRGRPRGPEPTGESVLARLEARRKEKEQAAASEGGLLGRLKAKRQVDDDEDTEDTDTRRASIGRTRPKMRMIDEEEEPAFAHLRSLSSIRSRGTGRAQKAPAKKRSPAKKAPAKKRSPAQKAPAKKAPANKKAPAPKKKAPLKKASAPKKSVRARRT